MPNKPGRKPDSPTGEAGKNYTVRVIPSLKERLCKRHGSLKKALEFADAADKAMKNFIHRARH